jgi:hypothetical protein
VYRNTSYIAEAYQNEIRDATASVSADELSACFTGILPEMQGMFKG